MIYFGREHCPKKNHESENCHICRWAGNALDETSHSKANASPFKEAVCPSPVKLEPGSPSNYKKHKGIITYNDRHKAIREASVCKVEPKVEPIVEPNVEPTFHVKSERGAKRKKR